MNAFLVTVAEQLSLVLADQLDEVRLLAGILVGRLDGALSRARDLAIDTCYDAGLIPRCARCGEMIHEPEPIVAGRCPRCDHIVDCVADGQLDEYEAQFAEPARVDRSAGLFDDRDHRSSGGTLFSNGGGI